MIPIWWSLLLAALGLAGIWLAGRKDARGWLLGALTQILWIVYALATGQPGFILTALAYGFVYSKNWWSWRVG